MLFNCGVGEDSWESLGLQGDQSWVFFGRTDVEAETPVLWPPDAKSSLFWKDPYAGKDWRWEKKGRQRMRWLDYITNSVDMSLGHSGSRCWTGRPGVLQSMGWQRVTHDWATKLNVTLILFVDTFNFCFSLIIIYFIKNSEIFLWNLCKMLMFLKLHI